jgi:SPP1 family phage portal protein
MKIEEILALTDINEKFKQLKQRATTAPVVADIEKEYIPAQHKIFDTTERPDKLVKQEDGSTRTEKVARIAVALQKIIVKSSAMFTFGRKVRLNAEALDNNTKLLFSAVKKIWKDTKLDFLNRKLGRCVFAYTEAAEIWYPVEGSEMNNRYGFDTKFKMRCLIVSPALGDTLYPLFDEYGDLIAFSREFTRTESGVKIKCFETYTSLQIIKWQEVDGNYVEVSNEKNVVEKIPVIYARQDEVEWVDVQHLIDRLEKLLSNFGDTNDYHASPKIFIVGGIKGFAKKGEAGGIIEGETGSEAKYLSWDQAPEAVKLEIDTLVKFIYSITQTADISFDSVKGLGNISGVALELLFMNPHLKVEDKKEIFGEYMQRRVNLLKAFVGVMNNSLKDVQLDIDTEITPYMIDDQASYIDMLSTANGGKPVVSQKTAIRMANLVEDADAELIQIQAEEKASNTVDLFGSGA